MKKYLLVVYLLLGTHFMAKAQNCAKDTLYFSTVQRGDTLSVLVKKTIRDTIQIKGDTNSAFTVYLTSTKNGNFGVLKTSKFCVNQGLRWVMDSVGYNVQTNICYVKKVFVFSSKDNDLFITDTSWNELFTIELRGMSDTIVPWINIRAQHLSYDSFKLGKWQTPYCWINKAGFIEQNPQNQDCNGTLVYLDAQSGKRINLGLKFGSLTRDIAPLGVCKDSSVVCTVFDPEMNNLKPVDTSVIQPDCILGRKWSTFGNVNDYQLFYNFDLRKSTDSSDFLKFLSVIEPCDFLFTFTYNAFDFNSITPQMDSLMSTFGADSFVNRKQIGSYVMIGRKGLNGSKALEKWHTSNYIWVGRNLYGQDDGNCGIDTIPFFSNIKPIFYQKGSGTIGFTTQANRVDGLFPNPCQDYLTIQNCVQAEYIVFNHIGTQVLLGRTANGIIDVQSLKSGMYSLVLTFDKRITKLKFSKE